jgi:hypothetical protein
MDWMPIDDREADEGCSAAAGDEIRAQ